MPADEPQKIFGDRPRRRGRQTFRLGDNVRITGGPFAAFVGRVEGINQSKALLKVRVNVFGRATPVKLSFADAEAIRFPPG